MVEEFADFIVTPRANPFAIFGDRDRRADCVRACLKEAVVWDGLFRWRIIAEGAGKRREIEFLTKTSGRK